MKNRQNILKQSTVLKSNQKSTSESQNKFINQSGNNGLPLIQSSL